MSLSKQDLITLGSVAAISGVAYVLYNELRQLRQEVFFANTRNKVEEEYRSTRRGSGRMSIQVRSPSKDHNDGADDFTSSLIADHPVHRICLTGGPCAGKTTALSVISDRFNSLGYRVFMVPEAATLLRRAGCIIANAFANSGYRIDFQRSLLDLQIALENAAVRVAHACGEKSVIVCDRGAMDGSAYMAPEEWRDMLHECRYNEVMLRDARYDTVVHLVTAADGAVDAYNLSTNQGVRHETVEEAINVDRLTQAAWVGHPHYHVVDNSLTFEMKLHRVCEIVAQHLDLPAASKKFRKFLAEFDPIKDEILALKKFEVEEIYISGGGPEDPVERKIRKRGHQGSFSYQLSEIYKTKEERLVVRRQLSSREYRTLRGQQQEGSKVVHKTRRSFLFENMYFVMDTMVEPGPEVTLLRVEADTTVQIQFPNWLSIQREVTGDKQYTTSHIAGVRREANHLENFESFPRRVSSNEFLNEFVDKMK